jgi:ATP-dependent Clp protease ATP-binding subunit ClpA
MTGIPISILSQTEGDRLLKLNGRLREKIMGQDDAIDIVVKVLLKNRATPSKQNQPIGLFLFLGIL